MINFRRVREEEINRAYKAALACALVFEEVRDVVGVPVRGGLPKAWMERYQGGTVLSLDDSVINFVRKVHVVYLGAHAGMYYSIEHLKVWPHYGLLCGEDLDTLFHRASQHLIPVKVYYPDRDYLTEKSIVVINNILQNITYGDFFHQNFDLTTINRLILQVKDLDPDGRNTVTSNCGFSGKLGQGWSVPFPELVKYSRDGKLNCPGLTRSMPDELLSPMGRALHCLGSVTKELWAAKGVPLFTDLERQKLCSSVLAQKLGFPGKVYFEAVTQGQTQFEHCIDNDTDMLGRFGMTGWGDDSVICKCGLSLSDHATKEEALKRPCLANHCDFMNDDGKSMHITGVCSFNILDLIDGGATREATIGYTRKLCGSYVAKVREARYTELRIDNGMELQLKECYNNGILLNAIEWAAMRWMGKELDRACSGQQTCTLVEKILSLVQKRGLNMTHEERPQIKCIMDAIHRLIPACTDVCDNLTSILLCLCWTISAHSKNHKKDGIKSICTMSKSDFLMHFSDYDSAFSWFSSLKSCKLTGGWVDVYGEYSLIRVIKNNIQHRSLMRLKKFVLMVRGTERLSAISCVAMLKKSKVYMLQGKLFQMMGVVVMKELGFIENDDDYKSFLPCPLTKSGGSVSIVAHALHLDKKIQSEAVREYILEFSKKYNIPAVVYENILCKFHVAVGKKYYSGFY